MTWSTARMARYVLQSKYLQQLKEKEDVCGQAFEKANYLLFSKDRALLTASSTSHLQSTIKWTAFQDTLSYCQQVKNSSVLLSIDESTEDTPLFACRIDEPERAEEIGTKYSARFSDMRMGILTLPKEEAQLLSRAYTLLTWNNKVKFCSFCASPLKRNLSGTVKECTKRCDPKSFNHYPPIFPVAITRVTDHTGEKALLVRQPQHPKGMYSCIAGFMEPGETLNDAVRREIAEEAGIVVENIQYFQSQTWPLPQNSLMIACTAVAMPDSENLDIDTGELEGAKWFTKAEVKAAFDRVVENPGLFGHNTNNDLIIPPNGAIAHQLMQNWVSDYTPSQL